jgi:hypothetical protein
MKQKFNKIRKVSEKKNQTEILEINSSLNQIKNIAEIHSRRLKEVGDQILGLKHKRLKSHKKKRKNSTTPSKD